MFALSSAFAALSALALMGGVSVTCGDLPTLYEFYTEGGVVSGLVPTADGFFLNGKPYYIAKEDEGSWCDSSRDVIVIIRPGPYICAEWEFGGLPSWLLSDKTMHVRTMYEGYRQRFVKYFEQLMPLLSNLQFTNDHGPIIAIQVENEYGHFGYGDHPRDKDYLRHIVVTLNRLGMREMLFTSDTPSITLDWGSISGVLQTANFKTGVTGELNRLKQLQPNMPLMVMEFWTGWFDHWSVDKHSGFSIEGFNSSLTEIFMNGASVNFYMFHGGTSFGFMNGANIIPDIFPSYLPDVTSYDYDALLSEAGDYTPKYDLAKHLINVFVDLKTKLPQPPAESRKTAFNAISIEAYQTLNALIDQVPNDLIVHSPNVLSMEELPIHGSSGQSYGFTVYRKKVQLEQDSLLKIRGHVRDFCQVMIDGQLRTPPVTKRSDLRNFGSWYPRDESFSLGSWKAIVTGDAVLDIVVENLGRANYGEPHNLVQKKGLWEGEILIDGQELTDWTIIPLEFSKPWVQQLHSWRAAGGAIDYIQGPVLVRATLLVDEPTDTFIDMTTWGKGVVFVNGFNLGRYWSQLGPQRTLYLPAPLLNRGANTIAIYEQYDAQPYIVFSDKPLLEF